MCRLLGFVADQPASVIEVLGRTAFDSFTALTCVHGDGWGMAWNSPDGVRTVSSPEPAADDPDYFAHADKPLSASGFVHLRWATDGLAVAPENTHPFSDGSSALAHNGSIAPIPRLEALLTPESASQLRGTTDSERYFRRMVDHMHADEESGVFDCVQELASAFPQCSLNALLLTQDALYAVHVNSSATPPLADLQAMFSTEEEIPHGHATSYFDMAMRITPTSVTIVSSGLVGEEWEPVPPNAVLRIDARTREITTRRVSV